MQFLRKSILLLFVVLVMTACSNKGETVDRQLLINAYYELLSLTDQLFMDHAFIDGNFVNQSFQTEAEIKDLLKGKVTANGINKIIEGIFHREGNLLVYKDHYQVYLEELRKYSTDSNHMNLYYSTVRETILNPALQLVYEEQLTVSNNGNKVELKGNKVPVTFYSQDGSPNKQQFKRYGYPPTDQVSMTFSFIYDNGQYLLDYFEVEVIDS